MFRAAVCFLPILLLLLLGSGCSSSHRLGESRVEARRYSRGWNVNVPSQHHQLTMKEVGSSASPSPMELERFTEDTKHLSIAAAEGDALTLTAGTSDVPEMQPQGQEWGGDPGNSLRSEGVPTPGNFLASPRGPHSKYREALSEGQAPVASTEEGLPEPELGRHPLAVPGFVLSLGWILGLAGAIALDYLGVSAPGLAFLLGLILSGFGYFESRKALRASRENPDLYPRSGLAKAGRWIALVPFGAMALYIILILGILLTW